MWAGKGHFNTALKDRDPIQWDLNEAGGMTLSILTVSHYITYYCPFSHSSCVRKLTLLPPALGLSPLALALLPLPLWLLLPVLLHLLLSLIPILSQLRSSHS